ncbi:retrovirus-related pol polyprotein from transposon TNT 1-94 [Tanacetum coccineum]
MLRCNLGDTLRRKGCDDSFLRWNMLWHNPSGMLRRKVSWALHFGAFLVQIPYLLLKCSLEPKNVNEALTDESWIIVMQEELNQSIANDVWELVPQPKNLKIIETKWVFRNKLDENGVVSRNKARLVAQGYNLQEGINYDETYAPVARLESIRILLAYACALDFKLFQIDVKSAFLNGFINEEASKTSHLEAVKRIFRYIKGTTHLGLWYPKGIDIETVVYADSDHAGDYVDRKRLAVFVRSWDVV